MEEWKQDLKVRRYFMFMFIGAVWFLLLFSMLIPKSERFNKYSAPFVEKIFGKTEVVEQAPAYLEQPMQRGSQGEQVKKLQEFLFQQGYTKNRPDGDFGRGTEKVVKAFQKAVGLEATGIVDAKTIETINKIVAETPQEEPATVEQVSEKPATTTTKPKETVQPKEEAKPQSVATPKTETTNKATEAREEAKPAEKAKPVERPAYTSTQPKPTQSTAPASNGNSVSLDQLMKMSKNKNNSEQ